MIGRGWRLLLVLIGLLGALPAAAQAAGELPPVDSVFRLSATATSRDVIQLQWRIADGYYLYRHRTAAQVQGAGFVAEALQLPDGAKHTDPFFGPVETYRAQLTARLPGRAAPGAQTIALQVKYQGCADAGICYPPQTRTLQVRLPAAAGDAGDAVPLPPPAGLPLPGLPGLPGSTAGPLPEAQAFAVEAIVVAPDRLMVRLAPAAGYYLYRDKTRFTLSPAAAGPLGTPAWPPARRHHDAHFGQVAVYFDAVDVPLPLRRTPGAAQAATLEVAFQGCQNDGICYPPMRRRLQIALPAFTAADAARLPPTPASALPEVGDAPAATPLSAAAALPPTTAATLPTSTPPARRDALLPALLLALLGGLILNLMPCVLPVLSLKALSLLHGGESRQRARRHALAYAAGVIGSMLALGLLVLVLRNGSQAVGWGFQLQTPWVVAALALLMFALGLSLSGLWYARIALPAGIGQPARDGALRGDVMTGVLAVVLAAPCTAPFMGAALGYAFAAPWLAGLLVFAMLGLGMALPFLLLGFVPQLAARLPRPGPWMETLKQLLAFPMYATAAWLLWVLAHQRGADAVGLWAVAAIALAMGLWMWSHAAHGGHRLWRVLALFAWLGGAAAVVGIARVPAADAGAGGQATLSAASPWSMARLAQLRSEGRPVLVNMTADWCITCKANERSVLARPAFREALQRTGTVYLIGDYTNQDPAITAYLRSFQAVGVPLYVVYPADGGAPRVLPTLLTPSVVEQALAQAAGR